MSKSDDVYAISGRIKNSVAMKDLAITEVGTLLINSYTMVLKDLHELANRMPIECRDPLKEELFEKEDFVVNVISLCTPKPEEESLWDKVQSSTPIFNTSEDALVYYTEKYNDLGHKYDVTGEKFYEESCLERACDGSDYAKIQEIHRHINMLNYLIDKDKP